MSTTQNNRPGSSVAVAQPRRNPGSVATGPTAAVARLLLSAAAAMKTDPDRRSVILAMLLSRLAPLEGQYAPAAVIQEMASIAGPTAAKNAVLILGAVGSGAGATETGFLRGLFKKATGVIGKGLRTVGGLVGGPIGIAATAAGTAVSHLSGSQMLDAARSAVDGMMAPTGTSVALNGQPATASTATVITQDPNSRGVNFRSAPSSSAQSFGLLPRGTVVEVTGTSGSWSRVRHAGREGYMATAYLASGTAQGGGVPSATMSILKQAAEGAMRTGFDQTPLGLPVQAGNAMLGVLTGLYNRLSGSRPAPAPIPVQPPMVRPPSPVPIAPPSSASYPVPVFAPGTTPADQWQEGYSYMMGGGSGAALPPAPQVLVDPFTGTAYDPATGQVLGDWASISGSGLTAPAPDPYGGAYGGGYAQPSEEAGWDSYGW